MARSSAHGHEIQLIIWSVSIRKDVQTSQAISAITDKPLFGNKHQYLFFVITLPNIIITSLIRYSQGQRWPKVASPLVNRFPLYVFILSFLSFSFVLYVKFVFFLLSFFILFCFARFPFSALLLLYLALHYFFFLLFCLLFFFFLLF